MRGPSRRHDRRSVLRALGLLGGLALVPGCSARFGEVALRLATGAPEGGYFRLGTVLAAVWQRELGLQALPTVLSTPGSMENVALLGAGSADVGFCQIDVAAHRISCCPPEDPRSPRALARIYDDVVHVVTARSSPITAFGQLRGARVSLGEPGSGVWFVATRLLTAAGIAEAELRVLRLGIGESATALAAGEIDAFFWTGSLPTQGVATLTAQLPIRLLDLTELVAPMRGRYPEYAAATLPAGIYGIPAPVTSLLVRNVLLVNPSMADGLAGALVRAVFAAQEELRGSSRTALSIDPRAAIGTQPVRLHPGAEQFYRDNDGF